MSSVVKCLNKMATLRQGWEGMTVQPVVGVSTTLVVLEDINWLDRFRRCHVDNTSHGAHPWQVESLSNALSVPREPSGRGKRLERQLI